MACQGVFEVSLGGEKQAARQGSKRKCQGPMVKFLCFFVSLLFSRMQLKFRCVKHTRKAFSNPRGERQITNNNKKQNKVVAPSKSLQRRSAYASPGSHCVRWYVKIEGQTANRLGGDDGPSNGTAPFLPSLSLARSGHAVRSKIKTSTPTSY